MVILRPIGGYPEFYPEVLWADGQLAIQAQVTREANWDSEDFYQNQGDPGRVREAIAGIASKCS